MSDSAIRRGLSVRTHKALGIGALCLVAVVAYGAGVMSRDGQPFPYDVIDRRLVGENGTSKETLVRIPQSGEINMQRLIEYHEPNCERWYARRVVSGVADARGAVRVERYPEVHDQMLPVDLSGRWQEWKETLPHDFTCGPAYLAETVTAACTWYQRLFRRLQKPDIITPFTVACPAQTP